MKPIKHILTASVLALILAGGMVLHLALPDRELSRSERRHLLQFSDISLTSAQEVEDYLLDQFPLRDGFRSLKALWTYYVLGQQDNNGIFVKDGSVSKLDGELDEKQLKYFIDKFASLQAQYFPDSKVTCAVIPDKNFYLADGNMPRLDYERLFAAVEQGLPRVQHVRLTGALSAGQYYTTDSHWRQEELQTVRDLLAEEMDLQLPDWDSYEKTVLPGFYGVYYGQSALPLPAEDLVYLQNDVTEQAVVTGPELQGEQPVYAPEKFEGMDGYDVFLHGAQAVQTIENPLAQTERELIIFRDSYGSALAPLLLPGYKTVTLVDIRYVASSALENFVDFHGQDVLILYSTTLINGAGVLR